MCVHDSTQVDEEERNCCWTIVARTMKARSVRSSREGRREVPGNVTPDITYKSERAGKVWHRKCRWDGKEWVTMYRACKSFEAAGEQSAYRPEISCTVYKQDNNNFILYILSRGQSGEHVSPCTVAALKSCGRYHAARGPRSRHVSYIISTSIIHSARRESNIICTVRVTCTSK